MEEVFDFIQSWDDKRFDLDYATDGVVVKINDLAQQAGTWIHQEVQDGL